MPRPLSGPPGRRARATLALFAVALAAALGVRAWRAERGAVAAPTGAAEWIWAPLGRTVEPLAFYAARDVELAAPPAAARLAAAADEEYVLFLNGRRVGSGGAGSAGAGTPPALDTYDVAPLLRAGSNRLVAELRSGRGAGGFLALLTDGAGRTLAKTDRDWRIVRRHRPGLVRGWLPLDGPAASEDERADSWSRPPVGRWGAPRAAVRRPLFAAGGLPVEGSDRAAAATVVRSGPGLGRGMVRLDFGSLPAGCPAGYLTLEIAPRRRRQLGLLYADPPVPGAPPLAVVVAPGAPTWRDVQPRSVHRLLLAGDLEVAAARLEPAAGVPLAAAFAKSVVTRGLLGLAPPAEKTPLEDEVWREMLRAPVQDEVWRELQRLARVSGRKDL